MDDELKLDTESEAISQQDQSWSRDRSRGDFPSIRDEYIWLNRVEDIEALV